MITFKILGEALNMSYYFTPSNNKARIFIGRNNFRLD